MDPLSCASACLELAEFVAKCIKLLKKIKRAHRLVTDYIARVQEAEEINGNIKENKALQTKSVEKGVRACSQTIEQLCRILERFDFTEGAGLWRNIKSRLGSVLKDSRILELFKSLEEGKSNLLLRITEENAGKLGQIADVCGDIQQQIHNRAVTEPLQHDPGHVDEPQIYEVPSRHTSCFIGRQDLLTKLTTVVTQTPRADTDGGSDVGAKVIVIRALGGQGKSQVALQLCRRLRDSNLSAIIWIDASSESNLKSHFEGIAEIMHGSGPALTTLKAKIAFVKKKLEQSHQPWLLVLDNFDDPGRIPGIRDYIPDNSLGTVLMTSRHCDAFNFATDMEYEIELDGLEEHEALTLLMKLSKAKPAQAENAHGSEIVRSLAFHPLAITQAAAFIKKRQMGLPQFGHYYQRKKKDILDCMPNSMWSQYQRSRDGDEKELIMNVFTTWELSFQQLASNIREEDDEAYQVASITVLQLCAFAGNEGLSEDFLRIYICPTKEFHRSISLVSCLRPFIGPGVAGQPMGWDHDSYADCISRLVDFSLVQSSSLNQEEGACKISLHPLVRDWLRLRLSDKDQLDFVRKTTSLVGSILNEMSDDTTSTIPMSLSRRQEVLNHVRVLEEDYQSHQNALLWTSEESFSMSTQAGHMEQLKIHNAEMCEAQDQTKNPLLTTGASKVVSPSESKNSTQPRTTGASAWALPKDEVGVPLEVLKELDQVHQLTHDNRGTMGDHVAQCLHACARFCGTIYQGELGASLIQAAFPDWESLARTLPRNPLVAYLGFMIVSCLTLQEKDREAELCARRMISVYEKNPDTDAHKYLPFYFCGSALHHQGQYREAIDMSTQASKNLARIWGPYDQITLSAAGNLALSLGRAGQMEESQRLFKTTITSMKTHLPPQNPVTFDTEFKFVGILWTAGKKEEALELDRTILEWAEQVLGEEHKETVRCMRSFANLLESSGRSEEGKLLRDRIARLTAKLVC